MTRSPGVQAALDRVKANRQASEPKSNGADGPTIAGQGGLTLDPLDPAPAARALVKAEFMAAGARALHRHRGSFWRYGGNCYRPADDEELRAAVWRFLERAKKLDGKGNPQPFKPTQARVSDVLDALKATATLDSAVAPPAWLEGADGNPAPHELLAVANGLLHLATGRLLRPTPAFFALNASDIMFDQKAELPRRWLAFLAELFGDDEQALESLQDWFGYCLTTDTSQQKIMLMVGPPRSGKGTIARILKAVVGQDSVAGPTLASLASNFGLEPLIGKPLAIISDARLGSRSDHAAIAERLLSISGEDALTIDRKFLRAWHGTLPTRFMLLTNQLPGLADSSGALVGRFIVLQLTESFYGREDPGLTAALMTELPGILGWALDGYRRLHLRGHFIQPASAFEAIADLEVLAAPIKGFANERCFIGPMHQVAVDDLWNAWLRWCEANGRKEAGVKSWFGRDLSSAFPSIRRRQPRDGETRRPMYQGICLR